MSPGLAFNKFIEQLKPTRRSRAQWRPCGDRRALAGSARKTRLKVVLCISLMPQSSAGSLTKQTSGYRAGDAPPAARRTALKSEMDEREDVQGSRGTPTLRKRRTSTAAENSDGVEEEARLTPAAPPRQPKSASLHHSAPMPCAPVPPHHRARMSWRRRHAICTRHIASRPTPSARTPQPSRWPTFLLAAVAAQPTARLFVRQDAPDEDELGPGLEKQAVVGRKRRAPSSSPPPRDGRREMGRASGVSDEVRCAKCGSKHTQRWGWDGDMLCEACYLASSTPGAAATKWRVGDRVHARHGSVRSMSPGSAQLTWPPAAREVDSLPQGRSPGPEWMMACSKEEWRALAECGCRREAAAALWLVPA